MNRILFCTKCGQEFEWTVGRINQCDCGSRRFSTERQERPIERVYDWTLTEGEKLFLRALRISPD